MAVSGCQTQDSATLAAQARAVQEANKGSEIQTVREGDVLKISFPGAPALDTQQTVRRDGRVTLNVVGEFKAVGLTPAEMEKQLAQLYSSQLVEKEVTVTVVSSSFSVYVGGAVLRPGKVISDHPLTLLEAIMESGGWDAMKADIRQVRVIRNVGGHTVNLTVNLKDTVEGVQNESFNLKPSDIVYVPERFTWF